MLSCQGTEPAEELKYNFRYSRCFFAAVLSRLEPLTLSTSCMFAEVRHKPGMIWWLVFSASIAAFWSAGYRIRIKLCKMTQASTMIAIVSRVVLHRSEEDLPTLRQDAEGILNDSAPPRQSVIEDSLLLRQLALCIRLHEVCAKSKSIVTNDVVRCWSVIIG